MKFKWLSGDFVAEYSRSMREYRKVQDMIDRDFGEKLEALISRESSRLEQTVPVKFKNGTKVRSYDNKVGTVVGSKIDLFMKRGGRDEWHMPVKGPGQYWPVETPEDEIIITCEGFLRLYDVRFDSQDIEKDWGIEEKIISMYADEFEALEKNED